VELKATFPNADNALLPGQFVNVRLGVQTLPNVVVVPLAAVNRGPNGQFVFVVGPSNKVEMRAVTLAATQGQSAVVASGVKAGDMVVVDGQMTLTKGSLVKVTRLEPAPSPAP
jgi:multidrug efflux system membrane fusion protein